MTLTQSQLKSALKYDPRTGLFVWLKDVRTGRYGTQFACRKGDIAGSIGARGYVLIGVGGVVYRACRLAFLYRNGVWPTVDVDHINGDRSDDRWVNLREATRSENNQNQRIPRSNNKSGYLGVCAYRSKWHAQIKVDGVRHHLGYFEDPEEAHLVYLAAKVVLHPFATGD